MIDWHKRCKRRVLYGLLQISSWTSRCGNYKFEVTEWLGESEFPTRWRAMFRGDIISRHRKREPARRACEAHLKART